jgi:hypothetical protein
MTHHVYIEDAVVIRRRFEIPEACPHCKTRYGLGRAVITSTRLLPREETLMLTTVLGTDQTQREVVMVKERAPYQESPHQLIELKCTSCGFCLTSGLIRKYNLAEMGKLDAFKLRGVLYDSNAKDDEVQRKCYDETQGYHGDCLACNIEADIGTEEVPHPIDPRVHSCQKAGE